MPDQGLSPIRAARSGLFTGEIGPAWARRWYLPAWFAANAALLALRLIGTKASFGFDARLYRLAAEAWVAGGDPWAPTLYWDDLNPAIAYAGPPPTLIPFIALSWIPTDVFVLLFVLASASVAMWTLRRLGLPIWWMLFPPLIEGIWVGNLNVFVIALLVAGGSVAGGIATVLKVYAAIPLVLLGQWRPLAVAGALVLASAPFLPWPQFVLHYPRISASLAEQAWAGQETVFMSPLVTAGAAMALALLGRQRAAWLAVPVLWPATQFHYAVIALPALAPPLAFFAAMNQPGYLAFGVIVYAVWVRRDLLLRRPAFSRAPHRHADRATLEIPDATADA